MGDTADVLVKFPPDLAASLTAEARALGVTRMALIIARCRGDGSAPEVVAPKAPARPGQAGASSAPTATQARPAVARAVLREAEAGAAHLGLGARAMAEAGVVLGNVRGPMQKRPPAKAADGRPAARR